MTANSYKILTQVIVGSIFASIIGTARAEHYTGNCAADLNNVESAIEAGHFLGKNAATDQSNMLIKLEAAAAKIRLKKFADAVDKLQNISDTATSLADGSKPKLADASLINGAVANAIGCVGAL